MNKTLVLIRHAKSDWGSGATTDFDRPLNERGLRDAPVMGARLKEKNIRPDLIIASTAVRAATTAKLIAEGVGYEPKAIQWKEELYHCTPATFTRVLEEAGIPDEVKTVFVVAHNPGITEYANEKVASLFLVNMPTCSTLAISFDMQHWNDIAAVTGKLLDFDYPKKQ